MFRVDSSNVSASIIQEAGIEFFSQKFSGLSSVDRWSRNVGSQFTFLRYVSMLHCCQNILLGSTHTVLLNVYVQDTDQSSGWLKNVSFEFGIYSLTDCVTD